MLRVLKDQSHFAAELPHGEAFPVNIFSIKINLSAGRFRQSVQMLRQRGFSGTGMSDQSHELPIRDFQIDIFERMHLIRGSLGIGITYIFDFN